MTEREVGGSQTRVDPSSAVVVHFYRAVVGHMDVWRQRMDATTNWAAATTAAMVTFSFGAPESPHFTLLLAAGFDVMFLMMESRRYQIFDLWRRRFRMLNRHMIAPALGAPGSGQGADLAALGDIGVELGKLVPHLTTPQAVGYRLRRNYGYVFALVLFAWLLKLQVHPAGATHPWQLVERAAIGPLLPGVVVMALVLVAAGAATVLMLAAPTEQMVDWTDLPSPLQRIVSRGPESP